MSAQDSALDRLAEAHGRVHIADGFEHGDVRATIPSGAEFRVGLDGVAHKIGLNFSVDWEA
jgi:hypothetical protein